MPRRFKKPKVRLVSKADAIAWAKSPAELARLMGVSRQAVHKWSAWPPPRRQRTIKQLMRDQKRGTSR